MGATRRKFGAEFKLPNKTAWLDGSFGGSLSPIAMTIWASACANAAELYFQLRGRLLSLGLFPNTEITMPSNLSIATDPQQQKAASQQVAVVRSSSRQRAGERGGGIDPRLAVIRI